MQIMSDFLEELYADIDSMEVIYIYVYYILPTDKQIDRKHTHCD